MGSRGGIGGGIVCMNQSQQQCSRRLRWRTLPYGLGLSQQQTSPKRCALRPVCAPNDIWHIIGTWQLRLMLTFPFRELHGCSFIARNNHLPYYRSSNASAGCALMHGAFPARTGQAADTLAGLLACYLVPTLCHPEGSSLPQAQAKQWMQS